MNRTILRSAFIAAVILTGTPLHAQQKFWVEFRDKPGVSFNPYEYFDARTIRKREAKGLPLAAYTDLPLKTRYVDSVNAISPVSSSSRWLNAVAVSLTSSQKAEVLRFPFVRDVRPVEGLHVTAFRPSLSPPDSGMISLIRAQTGSMGGELFTRSGIDGHGVRIAVLDAGFPGVDTLPEFTKIRDEGRIIDTWDFVKKNRNVYRFNSHGTGVLACIAGVEDSLNTGLATGAEFLLARTEVQAEVFSEEENWFAAIEWADRLGADIISSSLGYTFNRYFPKQMNGKTTFVSRMANLAADKGLLVINAAGNDGDNDWEVIGAPADADSVLSVGGINSETGIHIDFSSYGPTYDGRLKPNVTAFADVITVGKHGDLKKEYGTSFSTPLVTGFAACVMQMHPDWNNMKVFEEIEKSGHLYPYYDYAHGYGVPQASHFFGRPENARPTFTVKREYSFLTVFPDSAAAGLPFPPTIVPPSPLSLPPVPPVPGEPKDVSIIVRSGNKTVTINNAGRSGVTVEKRDDDVKTADTAFYHLDDRYLYYHFADRQTGIIRYYAVVDLGDAKRYSIDLDNMKDNELVMIHYRGYTQSYSK